MEPWICHEAGHVITALHLGFHVDGIEIIQANQELCATFTPRREQTRNVTFFWLVGSQVKLAILGTTTAQLVGTIKQESPSWAAAQFN